MKSPQINGDVESEMGVFQIGGPDGCVRRLSFRKRQGASPPYKSTVGPFLADFEDIQMKSMRR